MMMNMNAGKMKNQRESEHEGEKWNEYVWQQSLKTLGKRLNQRENDDEKKLNERIKETARNLCTNLR